MDKVIIPERPGELITIMGRPGDGKSSILAYRALREARLIQQTPEREGEIVLVVTWDDSVEEFENMIMNRWEGLSSTDVAWGRADIDTLRRRAAWRAQLPVWFIGHSITRSARNTGEAPPRLTPDYVFELIERMQAEYRGTEHPIKSISHVFIDYIQRIPVPGTSDRVAEVTEAVHRCKELAVRMGTRVVAAVQASRAVESLDIKLSEMTHFQHSSGGEQDSSKMLSIWRPWRSELAGVPPSRIIKSEYGVKMVRDAYIEMGPPNNRKSYPLTENLMFVQLIKQKGDSGRALFPLYFNPAYLTLADREEELYRRDGGEASEE